MVTHQQRWSFIHCCLCMMLLILGAEWQWQVVGWALMSLDPALSPLALLTSLSPAYLTSPSMGLMVAFPNTFSASLLSPSPFSACNRDILFPQSIPCSSPIRSSLDQKTYLLSPACPAPLCDARVGLDKLLLSSTQICAWPYAWGREEPSSLLSDYNMQVVQVADSLWNSDLQVCIRPCRCPLRGV